VQGLAAQGKTVGRTLEAIHPNQCKSSPTHTVVLQTAPDLIGPTSALWNYPAFAVFVQMEFDLSCTVVFG
jgi:hypothetical protein